MTAITDRDPAKATGAPPAILESLTDRARLVPRNIAGHSRCIVSGSFVLLDQLLIRLSARSRRSWQAD
jgi:hypothetical protein